jgi:hypothetical protein
LETSECRMTLPYCAERSQSDMLWRKPKELSARRHSDLPPRRHTDVSYEALRRTTRGLPEFLPAPNADAFVFPEQAFAQQEWVSEAMPELEKITFQFDEEQLLATALRLDIRDEQAYQDSLTALDLAGGRRPIRQGGDRRVREEGSCVTAGKLKEMEQARLALVERRWMESLHSSSIFQVCYVCGDTFLSSQLVPMQVCKHCWCFGCLEAAVAAALSGFSSRAIVCCKARMRLPIALVPSFSGEAELGQVNAHLRAERISREIVCDE